MSNYLICKEVLCHTKISQSNGYILYRVDWIFRFKCVGFLFLEIDKHKQKKILKFVVLLVSLQALNNIVEFISCNCNTQITAKRLRLFWFSQAWYGNGR